MLVYHFGVSCNISIDHSKDVHERTIDEQHDWECDDESIEIDALARHVIVEIPIIR